ncbi:MAG: SAM-dependent methyltransferase [Azospira oryzae]|nr:MAG: SAM-dependent methyltransferase [Azospira oryzae]PZP82120.1 MAG: SAM-dependent methyltransferase [Azospira oryzae]
MFFEKKVERFLEELGQKAQLPLRVELWNGRSIELSPHATVTLRINDPAAARYFLHPTLAKLGEAYVEGHVDVEGPLKDIISAAEGLSRRTDATGQGRLPLWRWAHSRRMDRKAIQYHYDVSNDFYALWLDRHMVYSCAYFKTGEEDIHTAQEQKLDHICRKLRLQPGDKFLDIGCGWGGLIRWAAKHYGVDATGITLSRNQYEYASKRIEEEGLSGRCRVLLQDYRDVPGEAVFDKIASVGMFEHVGLKNLPLYFGVIHRLLKPGGIVLNHGITAADPDNRWAPWGGGEFIEKYVFPHGELPHLSLAIREMSAQRLEVADVETLRLHYAKTLWHWAERLEQNRLRAAALAGEKRLRIWRVYLAGCAHAFEQGWVTIQQVLAFKPARAGESPLPWTRAYMYAPARDAEAAQPSEAMRLA